MKMFGEFTEIDGLKIHYEKVGNGNHYILLLPGGIGSSRSDFNVQLKDGDGGFDRTKFTMIAWDPPGYGYSRPPERFYCKDIYKRDADIAAKLMQKLGINTYSVIGWSDGGKTALLMAILYKSRVNKIATIAGNAYTIPHDRIALSATRDISIWNPMVRDAYSKVYGNELQTLWERHVDFYVNNLGDICKNEVKQIMCPALILHGGVDPLSLIEHPNYLIKQIRDSRLHIFTKGSHNMHQQFPIEFKNIVQSFLLE